MTSSGAVTLPIPWVVPPTYNFEGLDGNWSTFALEVGTPPQPFNVLPATVGQEVWVPIMEGCSSSIASNCSAARGVGDASSTGFSTGNSSTWNNLGFFGLDTETNLFPATNAAYGLDTLVLAKNTSSGLGPQIPGQIIAAYNTLNFWFGQIGLSNLAGNFNSNTYSSPLSSMKSANLTTSLSFGYTAGKSYTGAPGSLVLGGFDNGRITGQPLSFPIPPSAPATLPINITSIQTTATLYGGQQNIMSTPMTMNIDSSTSLIWLPGEACDTLVSQFGLHFDNVTSLYFLNDSVHNQLKSRNPVFYFSVGSGSAKMNIRIPYSAFDLTYNYIDKPSNFTSYFPIRKAANASQLTLGRAFLQEAYVIVDWERRNLTIAQATDSNSSTGITPINPLSSGSPSNSGPDGQSGQGSSSSKGAPIGGIVGGVVGGVLGLLAIGLGIWWWRRKRNGPSQAPPPKDVEQAPIEQQPDPAGYYHDEVVKPPPQSPEPEEPVGGWYLPEKTQQHEEEKSEAVGVDAYELSSPGAGPAELASSQRYELAGAVVPDRGVPNRGELMSTPIHEMAGSDVGSELDVGSRRGTRRRTPDIARSPPFSSSTPEILGAPSPELFMSPINSSSSVQVASSSAVHHFSSAHQEVVSSSEIVSSSTERDRMGGTASEIVVSSSPQQVASPLPVRENTSPLANQPAEDLVRSHEMGSTVRSE